MAKKSGPKSRAEIDTNVVALNVKNVRPTLTPLSPLGTYERKLFTCVARNAPHLLPCDVPLLTTFCIVNARMVNAKSTSDTEKLAKMSAMLATKLRLTPQSRSRPEAVARGVHDVRNKNCWDHDGVEPDDEAG